MQRSFSWEDIYVLCCHENLFHNKCLFVEAFGRLIRKSVFILEEHRKGYVVGLFKEAVTERAKHAMNASRWHTELEYLDSHL